MQGRGLIQVSTEGSYKEDLGVMGKLKRMTRRRALRVLAGGAAVPILMGGYAWRIEPVWETVRQVDMPIRGLATSLVGKRMVQLSDLHIGAGVPWSHYQSVIDKVNRLDPDLIVITGDIVHQGRERPEGQIARLMEALSGEAVKLASLGNHDWSVWGPKRSGYRQGADRVAKATADAGVFVLRNEVYRLGDDKGAVQVLGLEDYWSDDYDLDHAMGLVDPELPCIALSHNPDTFMELSETSVQWTLSGHTHGGQVRIPFYGAPLLPIRHKEFVAGHFTRHGNHLYVNRGIGWLKRVRFCARPEITVFTLASA